MQRTFGAELRDQNVGGEQNAHGGTNRVGEIEQWEGCLSAVAAMRIIATPNSGKVAPSKMAMGPVMATAMTILNDSATKGLKPATLS